MPSAPRWLPHPHLRLLLVLLLLRPLRGTTSASTPLLPGNESFETGFVNVTGGSMFYWYSRPRNGDAEAPLLVWLQGGPGSSGLRSLFFSNGPYYVTSATEVELRDDAWNNQYHVVWMDNPIGTGFSYVHSDNDYSSNMQEVTDNLVLFLLGFYSSFPELKDNDLYLTGQSFGGKYVPWLAHALLEGNANGTLPYNVPLKGVAIGNSLVDPCTQVLTRPDAAYVFGLVDATQRDDAMAYANLAVESCDKELWTQAHANRTLMEDTVKDACGSCNFFDVRTFTSYGFMGVRLGDLFAEDGWPELLGTGSHDWETDDGVGDALFDEKMKSSMFLFPYLLERIPVMLYQGAVDWKCGPTANEQWIDRLEWGGAEGFAAAERTLWYAESDAAGFVRAYDNLTHVIIPNAGHYTPMNQPARALAMIQHFVRGVPLAEAPYDDDGFAGLGASDDAVVGSDDCGCEALSGSSAGGGSGGSERWYGDKTTAVMALSVLNAVLLAVVAALVAATAWYRNKAVNKVKLEESPLLRSFSVAEEGPSAGAVAMTGAWRRDGCGW